MPKNLKGGNKAKSQKNSSGPVKNREIAVPESDDDSHIAIVTNVRGDGRYLCQIVNMEGNQPTIYPVKLHSGIKNKYGRGIIISQGTYLLIAIREFQKDIADIIFVYRDSEISYLTSNNYFRVVKTTTVTNDSAANDFEFSEFATDNQHCDQSSDTANNKSDTQLSNTTNNKSGAQLVNTINNQLDTQSSNKDEIDYTNI